MPAPRNLFATTHWSVVLKAARDDTPEAAAALEQLCADYWYPLYAYLRRRGHSPAEAEDLTQTFFAERVVTRRILRDVQPASGRFRSWLLTCLQNRVATEWEHRHAQRRGGALPHQPLGIGEAESYDAQEPAAAPSPEYLYDRAWAITVLRRTLAQLRSRS
ncbi:MAG: sigma-70 family RNA polymerase sigma factor, partial [Verrucomicrobiales bacterium]|nr:sigma-70 family RNA polymerase sigma factor [Verrucomicrobiales bacterium]